MRDNISPRLPLDTILNHTDIVRRLAGHQSDTRVPLVRFAENRRWNRTVAIRIVDVIKFSIHPEVGILDNPRDRRFEPTIGRTSAPIIRGHCPCELVFRALLPVKPRK